MRFLMPKFVTFCQQLMLCALFISLSGCLGGTVAQQIARSIATSVADKAVGNAIAKQDQIANQDYRRAAASAKSNTPIEAIAPLKSNALMEVEVLNLVIGDEKMAIYDQAKRIGALNLPDAREWPRWHVAFGSSKRKSTKTEMVTFLIPPKFGKLPCGSIAVVEMAAPGDLNIAQYTSH